MRKNIKLFTAAIGALLLIVITLIARDRLLRILHSTFECGDGPRFELAASVPDKPTISMKLNPIQQQQLSEAFVGDREFRKWVVAGYNSCVVTKAQYRQDLAGFHGLDGLAREINEFTEKPSLSEQETAKLARLVSRYYELAHKWATE